MSHALERVHTDPRLRRRRKAVTRSRRRKLFTRSALLVALLFLIWAIAWSPLLNVRDVQLRIDSHQLHGLSSGPPAPARSEHEASPSYYARSPEGRGRGSAGRTARVRAPDWAGTPC